MTVNELLKRCVEARNDGHGDVIVGIPVNKGTGVMPIEDADIAEPGGWGSLVFSLSPVGELHTEEEKE